MTVQNPLSVADGAGSLLGLNDRVAVVVGGAGAGLGSSLCETLARAGCDVVVGDLDIERAREVAGLVESHGRKAVALEVDALSGQSMESLVHVAVDRFGRFDVAINNVGARGVRQSSLLDCTDDEYDRTVDLCLKSTFIALRAEASAMARLANPASIVNIASASAFVAADGFGLYGAGKAGVTQLTKTAAVELGRFGIRVNCVAPGVMANDMPTSEGARRFRRDNEKATVLNRVGAFDEVAGVAVFLASRMADYVTGQTVIADGGQSLRVNRPQRDPDPAVLAATGVRPQFEVPVSVLAT